MTLLPKQPMASQEPLELNETWEYQSVHLKDDFVSWHNLDRDLPVFFPEARKEKIVTKQESECLWRNSRRFLNNLDQKTVGSISWLPIARSFPQGEKAIA